MNLDSNKIISFQKRITEEVNLYFATTKKSPHFAPAFYFKMFIILSWAIASYYLLVFADVSVAYKIFFLISLSFAIAGIGMNISHDANHSACSRYGWINSILSYSFEIIGVSSYVWRLKHNFFHHYYTNIKNLDPDLNHSILIRTVPEEPYHFFHYFQPFYIWFIFLLFPFRWHLTSDWIYLLRTFKKQTKKLTFFKKTSILARFISGKIISLTIYFGIPLFYYSFGVVLLCYIFFVCIVGLILGPIFDVAHINDKVTFIPSNASLNNLNNEHILQQISTTSNFKTKNKLFNWYIGGLNYQIEHHLFPSTCHTYYPALSQIVSKICEEFGVKYQQFDSFYDALCSHHRWLKTMGNPAKTVAPL